MALTLFQSLVPLTCLLLSLAAWLVRHYASPGTSMLTQLLVVVAFALGFAGVALLPIDLSLTTSIIDLESESQPVTDDTAAASDGSSSLSSSTDDGTYYQSVNATYVPWLITYWSTFVLAWSVLPLVREVLLSGHFTLTTRLRDGARQYVKKNLIMAVVAVVTIISLAVYLRSLDVVPVLMALGNTYGLLLVALLLGYGLVDLPRRWWRQADPELELRRARIIAGTADEALFDAVWELQDCEESIDAAVSAIDDARRRKGNASSDTPDDVYYMDAVDKLLRRRDETATLSPELERRRTAQHHRDDDGGSGGSNHNNNGHESPRGGGETTVSDGSEEDLRPPIDKLAKLGARLKRAQAQLVSAEQRWNSLVDRSRFLVDLTSESGNMPWPTRSNVGSSLLSLDQANVRLSICGRRIQYVWTKYLRSSTFRVAGMVTAVLSVMVLWSEATLALPINLSPFALFLGVTDGQTGRGVPYRIAALIPLLYMSVCVYSSLFKLSIFGQFCLRGCKQSPGVALVFNAQYLVRLQFSLIYNYLLMLKYDTSSTTCAFSKIMSNMETVPFLGTSFSIYAPLAILALCGFTLCNGYPRLLSMLGFDHEDAILLSDQETLDGKVNEGITLLRRHSERRASRSETEDLKLELKTTSTLSRHSSNKSSFQNEII